MKEIINIFAFMHCIQNQLRRQRTKYQQIFILMMSNIYKREEKYIQYNTAKLVI